MSNVLKGIYDPPTKRAFIVSHVASTDPAGPCDASSLPSIRGRPHGRPIVRAGWVHLPTQHIRIMYPGGGASRRQPTGHTVPRQDRLILRCESYDWKRCLLRRLPRRPKTAVCVSTQRRFPWSSGRNHECLHVADVHQNAASPELQRRGRCSRKLHLRASVRRTS